MFVIQDFGASELFPSTVGGTGTSAKYFGRVSAGATWVSAPSTPSSTNATGALVVPGDNKLNGQLFEVVATGSFKPGLGVTSSETVNVGLYAVTGSFTSPTYTLLADINSFSPGVDGINYNFLIRASLTGNNDSGIVGGYYTALVNNTVQRNNVALQGSLTGISFGQVGASPNQLPGALGGPFGLVVGVTFSQTASDNAAKLYQFQIFA